MTGPQRRTHLHLLARRDPTALRAMELQRRSGVEVRCVLLHDAVLGGDEGLPCDTVALRAEDVRRRGIGAHGLATLEDDEIVDLIATCAAATSWP